MSLNRRLALLLLAWLALMIVVIAPVLGAETYTSELTFGSKGNGDGQFGGTSTGPWGISVDEFGMIYVADTDNHRIQVFTEGGYLWKSWGGYGSVMPEMLTPHGVLASRSLYVYVADSSNGRIQKFTGTGNWSGYWDLPKKASPIPGQYELAYPKGIAEGPLGRIWVTDETMDRLYAYTSGGEQITYINVNDPTGVAVSKSGTVYVASSASGRMYRYSQEGRYLLQFGEPGSGPGQFDHPNGVAVDTEGNVYVADSGNHRIQKFDSGGHFVTSFGTRGNGTGQFEYPEGVAVDTDGNVFVTDRNCRVQKFTREGSNPIVPPAAAYWMSAWSGEAPFGIQFADGSSGNPTAWLWEFGDGTTSTEENPYHIFTTAGTYSPKLTVWNAAGGTWVTLGDRKITITESSYRFVRTFGSTGTGEGQVQQPRGLALGLDDRLYVMDRGTHRVTAFSAGGAFLFSFGHEGVWYGGADPPIDEFLEASVLATAPSGTVYVGDQEYQRVKVFSGDGTALGQFRPTGLRLAAMTVGQDGSIFVVCDGAKTIEKYTPAGSMITSFSTVPPGADAAGYSGRPLALACDPQGDIWLLDPGSETMMVREYGPDGAFLSGWGRKGTSPGEIDLREYSQFQAIAVDPAGNVYVTGESSGISKFAPDGTFITRFGSPGTEDGQIGSPVALTVDATGCVYVASWDGRVQEFAPAGTSPDTTPPASVTGLRNTTYQPTHIRWAWTDPTTTDYAKVMVYLNGAFAANVTRGTMVYNATALSASTAYTISTKTVDTAGNVNATWVNLTTRTAPPGVLLAPGGAGLPTDTNGDGKYDDVNGNGRKDFADVVLYFNQMSWIGANEPVSLFDFNGNGRIDFADVVWLFNHL